MTDNFSPSSSSPLVAVIGAGISGLCVAYFLRKKGLNVIVLERDETVGGTMKTIHDDGWLIETGPNSALETTPLVRKLVDELQLGTQFLYANDEAKHRFILRGGKLYPLPTSPTTFLTSKLWSFAGKARLLKEPFIGRAKKEESIAEFVERRLGREFLNYAIDPFVAGVYAGDPKLLSVQAAFPKLYGLEEKYGGLIKGMARGRKERARRSEISKDRARLFSFRDGMEVLPRSIAGFLDNAVRLGSTVEHIIPLRAGARPVYTVTYSEKGVQRSLQAAAVVLAAPAFATAQLIERIDPEMSKTLSTIYYPPVTEVFTGFRRDQVKRSLDGFGFLVPSVERRKILGTIWSSSLFPHRAPENSVALTTFVGGARQPEIASESDENLVRIVCEEFQNLLSIEGSPSFVKITRWQKAIPQYNIGYHKILKAIERFEENFRGAFISANFRCGIAVGDCLISAEKTAQEMSTYLDIL